ncbi:MAG: HAD family hydrolase [Candidatus Rokubacteria bacterium]|nr:HAD family hydrolase [Candidatus Rokubacteria bacterium]
MGPIAIEKVFNKIVPDLAAPVKGCGSIPLVSVRAVLFDAGNTLLEINYQEIANGLGQGGVEVSSGALRVAEQKARIRLDQDLGSLKSTEAAETFRRYLGYILENAGIAWDERAEATWRALRTYNPPVGVWHCQMPQASLVLARLRDEGLVVGCISNSNGSVAQALEQAGLASHLDFILDSGIVGIEKPDPRIFQLALDTAGLGPEEVVFVGDLYSIDVVGAKRAGLKAILLDPLGLWPHNDCLKCRDLVEAASLATRM